MPNHPSVSATDSKNTKDKLSDEADGLPNLPVVGSRKLAPPNHSDVLIQPESALPQGRGPAPTERHPGALRSTWGHKTSTACAGLEIERNNPDRCCCQPSLSACRLSEGTDDLPGGWTLTCRFNLSVWGPDVAH